MKRYIFIFVLLFSTVMLPQSIYSKFGIGELQMIGSVRSLGMAGTGAAFEDADFINRVNPAGLSLIDLTRVEFDFRAQGLSAKTVTDKRFFSGISFTGFTFSFPVYRPYGMTFSSGLVPFSSMNYRVKAMAQDSIAGKSTTELEGKGGLNKMYASFSSILPMNFKFGAALNYVFGESENNSVITFDGGYSKGEFLNSSVSDGLGYSFGLISPNLADLFSKNVFHSIHLTAVTDLYSALKTDRYSILKSTISQDTVIRTNGDIELPSRIIFGASVQMKNGYRFAVDYSTQDWSKMKLFGQSDLHFQKSSRFSLGVEYASARETGFETGTTYLRCGVGYETTPYMINSTSLKAYFASVGASFPIGRKNYFDLALSFLTRGTTDAGLIKENVFKIDASLNFGELWFFRQDR